LKSNGSERNALYLRMESIYTVELLKIKCRPLKSMIQILKLNFQGIILLNWLQLQWLAMNILLIEWNLSPDPPNKFMAVLKNKGFTMKFTETQWRKIQMLRKISSLTSGITTSIALTTLSPPVSTKEVWTTTAGRENNSSALKNSVNKAFEKGNFENFTV